MAEKSQKPQNLKLIPLFVHGEKEYAWDEGEKAGLSGDALQMFKFVNMEHEIEYLVDMETGVGNPHRLDGCLLIPSKSSDGVNPLSGRKPKGSRLGRGYCLSCGRHDVACLVFEDREAYSDDMMCLECLEEGVRRIRGAAGK